MKKILSYLFLLVTVLVLFGCDNTNNATDNTYNVTVTGSKGSLMQPIMSSYESGTIVEIKSYPVTDVSLHVFVNGQKIPRSHFDSDYWGYEFVMPAKDIVIHLTYDPFYGREKYEFNELCWNLDNLEKEISKVAIKTINYTENNNFIVTKYSFKKEDIDNFKAIVNQKLIKVDDSIVSNATFGNDFLFYSNINSQDELINSFGFEDEFFIWNDFSSFQAFRFENEDYILPNIENPDLVTYSFRYDGLSSDVKRYDDDSLIERYYNIASVEFIPYEGEKINMDLGFYLDSRYGKINMLTPTIFELNGTCYEIISGVEYWAYNYLNLDN